MQVNHLNITDFIQKETGTKEINIASNGQTGKVSKDAGCEYSKGLRSVSVNGTTYGKSFLSEEKESALFDAVKDDKSATQLKNEMVLASETTDGVDYEELEKKGYAAMDTDPTEYVTIADKIRLQLAKAGVDVSKMGGISDNALQNIIGESSQAIIMENEINRLSPSGVKYMVVNDLEPSIENLYKASFSEGNSANENTYATLECDNRIDISGMEEQITSIIEQSGLTVNNETMEKCEWMMEQEIPLTPENLAYVQDLSQFENHYSSEEILDKIIMAVSEGKEPKQAILLDGYSLMDQAKDICDVVKNTTETQIQEVINRGEIVNVANISKEMTSQKMMEEDAAKENQQNSPQAVSAYRQLEEIRLMMTTEANYTLLKKGIAIDTESLADLVEQLKLLEASMTEGMPEDLVGLKQQEASRGAVEAFTGENVEIYQNFTKQVAELSAMPASILGKEDAAKWVSESTVGDLYKEGSVLKDTYEKANKSYEALMTMPRKDMGDSINKAFANVDDILKDLGLETSLSNQRAVRILGYNSMDITTENIAQVKAADEQVQRLFKNMTPSVVTEMMKQKINPLDMDIDALNNVTEEIQSASGATSEEERFSKYLWKLEHTDGITPEERESFIGVYRLIHQVEATDGAAIGSLLQQGTDVTLRNLMTAVRNKKHSNMEYGIDDSFGALKEIQKTDLSITQQIEVVYQTQCMQDAKDVITPGKMLQFENENTYMQMTPEQFSDALSGMDEDTSVEEAYYQQIKNDVATATASEEQIYEVLSKYDIPSTPANLQAMASFMKNKNKLYRDLLEPEDAKEDINLEMIKNQLIEDYGEAVKTPKEMAEAQRKLEEVAENAMRKMLVEQDVRSIDVRGMKLIMTQISNLGAIADKEENYNIPIMVADEVGNMSLKIVRGENKKGLVDIAFDMESTGVVNASFRYEHGMVEGSIESSRQETREMLAQHMGLIAENLANATGEGVSLSFAWKENAKEMDAFEEKDAGFSITKERSDEILTSKLYGIARSFVDTLGEIAS